MPKKTFHLFILFLVFSAVPSLVHADNQTVFGPRIFEIGRWHVLLSVHTFNVEDPGEGVITITKNTHDELIRGGFVFFNTTFVPIRDFLVGDQLVFEKQITLQSTNFITVFFRGTPEASVTIEVNKAGGPVSPPEVTFSANPETILLGESSTLTWSSTYTDTCVIEPGLGAVNVNGSTQVSPTETITYTITASGLGGTASDIVEVLVIPLPVDLDYGLFPDEHQGSGGLVGETVRILNGNTVEFRSDIVFPSPHSLDLFFAAIYNSRSNSSGVLGFGWSYTYSVVLDPAYEMAGQTYLKIVDQTGRAVYFKEETAGVYKGEFNERSQVKVEAGEYVWCCLDGSKYGFSATGQLLWIDDEKGNRLVLGYDAQNRMQTVTDISSGRVLTFNYTAGVLLESISGPITQGVPSGIWATYGYDVNQNLISVTYADGSGFDYTYSDPNDVHNLTEKKDKAGHLINTWLYDDRDRAVSNFSVQGKGVSIQYVSETQVVVTDAYGTIRTYTISEINEQKRVTAMQGPAGAPYIDSNVIRWVYDSQMNLVEAETIGGTIYQYQNYDVRGNPGTIKLAFGFSEERVITYTYHPDLNVPLTRTEASVLGSGNKETIFDYDDDGDTIPNESPISMLSRVIEKGFTKDISRAIVPYEYITAFTHNGKGQILSIDGPLPGSGDTTSFFYDAATGDLLSITMPLIGSTNFSNYNAAGQVDQATDVNGQSNSFTYDGRGRITVITHQADGSASSVSYNTAGLPDFRTDEDGVISSFEYDSVYGRLARRIDHEGNYIAYNYDVQGNLTEKSYYDPSGNRTNWKRSTYQGPVHSMPGKLYKEINPDDTFVQYGYDSEGNIASVTDPNGNTTFYDYDALNRLTTVTQPGNVITSYDYDIHGNLSSVTDAESHLTTYECDDMGRVLTSTSPDTGSSFYAYDEAGNLTHKTDAKGIAVGYAYDLLSRLTNVGFPDSSQNMTYTYDTGAYGMGRRTGMADPSGSTTFGYNSRGRLVQKTSVVNGYSYTVSQSLTSGGRVSSVVYPTGRTVDYDRSICACSIDAVSTTYNANTVSLLVNLSYRPFGIAKGMDTGSGGTVNNVFDQSGRLTVANPGADKERTYTYDAIGNFTSVSSSNVYWYNRAYTYDFLNRLEHAEGPFGTIDYTYDNVGNRLTKVMNGQTETYTYVTGTNWLQEFTGPVTYTYDAKGNITGIGNKVLVYNQYNRLIRVEEDSTILGEYTYNGLGQRVIKTASGVTTVFHYDFNGSIIAESLPDGTFTAEYLYKGKSRLAMVDIGSGEMFYFLNDRLGTPQMLTDASNTVVWEAIYKPFGEAEVNPNSSVVNNFRFPGQYYGAETGLHYNYFRYYDPKTGRYLTADPIGLVGMDTNLYGYSLNNPISGIDPLGLINWGAIAKGGFAVFGGSVTVGLGALASSSGVGAVGGLPAVLGGSATFSWGVSQIIVGFTDNEIPFMGTGEAVIKGSTEEGLLQDELLGINKLGNMLSTGRVQPSTIGKINTIIQSGYSIYDSGSQIKVGIDSNCE